jgi:hypothetical protein
VVWCDVMRCLAGGRCRSRICGGFGSVLRVRACVGCGLFNDLIGGFIVAVSCEGTHLDAYLVCSQTCSPDL